MQFGRWMITGTMIFILVLTVFPIGLLMTERLENRFPVQNNIQGPIDGIVVLGGTINQFATKYHGQPSLTAGAERLTEFIALAKRFPMAKLLFSGGSASYLYPDIKEADTARLFFKQMGLDTGRVMFEDKSRNTFENAIYSYKMAKPKPIERWVLITSASHMPRSIGVFRKAGWKAIPFPVDYSTFGPMQSRIDFDFTQGILRFGQALREWTALFLYWCLDRSDDVFPEPTY